MALDRQFIVRWQLPSDDAHSECSRRGGAYRGAMVYEMQGQYAHCVSRNRHSDVEWTNLDKRRSLRNARFGFPRPAHAVCFYTDQNGIGDTGDCWDIRSELVVIIHEHARKNGIARHSAARDRAGGFICRTACAQAKYCQQDHILSMYRVSHTVAARPPVALGCKASRALQGKDVCARACVKGLPSWVPGPVEATKLVTG